MDNEFQNENIEDISLFDHYVGIQFFSTPRIYFFGTKDLTLALGDKVIVETIKGLELGVVATEPIEIGRAHV